MPKIIGPNPREAINRIRGALTPESSAALDYTLATLLFQEGDLSAAERHYRDAIRKFPNFLRAYRNLGLVKLQRSQFAEAIPMLVKAMELGDNDAMLWGLLGFAYLNTDRPQSAMDAYRIAYVLQPANRDWKVGKAQSANLTEDHVTALALFRQLLAENPNQVDFWLVRANSFISPRPGGTGRPAIGDCPPHGAGRRPPPCVCWATSISTAAALSRRRGLHGSNRFGAPPSRRQCPLTPPAT